MCLILFAYRQHPQYPLIMAANRDEFYNRASLPAGFWEDCPGVLAGRDLEQGGSWMGVSRKGKIAAVTNYRDPLSHNPQAKSRGSLVSGYLCEDGDAFRYMEKLHPQADRYNGFNLLVGDREALYYYSNRQQQIYPVPAGIHGLSNHLLNTPWPKVILGKSRLAEIIRQPESEWENAVWQLLTDRTYPADSQLPATGVSLEWERALSSVFIVSPDYGTRTNTLLLVDHKGRMRFIEQTCHAGTAILEKREYELATDS